MNRVGSLLKKEDEEEQIIMKLLVDLIDGTPHQAEPDLGQLIDTARNFGAGPLFHAIFPLLMQPKLKDQERHLLIKVIGRVVYELGELVRPYVHKILVLIEPLMIDEDCSVRVGWREIISNLSKAAGLVTMIDAMRPDIHSLDEYVRNATAQSFSVVASTLGIPAVLPFLREVCQSKTNWKARYTGIIIVQQILVLIDCDVLLPHLRSLVETVKPRLNDDINKVRTIASLTLDALAQAAAPHGIEV